jgi:EAL domain-containing protein (putative c-di-GMP-specific phosphodiesterase class I)
LHQDVRSTRLLLVADNPALQEQVRVAAGALGVAVDIMPTVDAALSWLLRPERLCTHVLAQASIDPQRIDSLAGMVDEVTSRPTPLLLLGAHQDVGPSVLAVTDNSALAIAEAIRAYRPFAPPDLPVITAAELRRSLHAGMLRMRFQPVLDAATLEPLGLEALARLHHPELGILHPKDFMPQAEESGQERALTGIAAARAMLELRTLPGLPHSFSVNMPLATLCHLQGVDRARELCAVVGLDPARVSIEVLETMREPDLLILGQAVARWREAGFLVLIDDAGPRLPHWAKMMDLPFSGVKLDQTLVSDVPACFELGKRIAGDALQRGLYMIAEGIEDDASLERARALGADALQGFLFCRPLPARAVPIWLHEWRTGQLTRPASTAG